MTDQDKLREAIAYLRSDHGYTLSYAHHRDIVISAAESTLPKTREVDRWVLLRSWGDDVRAYVYDTFEQAETKRKEASSLDQHVTDWRIYGPLRVTVPA